MTLPTENKSSEDIVKEMLSEVDLKGVDLKDVVGKYNTILAVDKANNTTTPTEKIQKRLTNYVKGLKYHNFEAEAQANKNAEFHSDCAKAKSLDELSKAYQQFGKEYVEFLVGRNGEFDQLVSSTVRRVKRNFRDDNSALVLVLPYLTAEYENNHQSFHEYYDEIEICQDAAEGHYKAAIQVRNREMVDRSDLVVCCIEHNSGGAFRTVQYAKKKNKEIVNLSDQ